jgi:protein SCO1/2
VRGGRGIAVWLALLAGLGAGCGGEPPRAAPEVLGTAPGFRLVDQRGQPYGSAELAGRPWLADFIFTRCRMTCPPLTARMADLQRELGASESGREVHLVSFSVDPEHDRPEVLAEYAARYGADPSRWSFLTGDRQAIWELSAQGFKLPVGESPGRSDEPLFHSGRVVLVDGSGRIRGYYDVLEPEGYASLLADLRALDRAREGSS